MPYFCQKLGKMSQNLSSAAVVIGPLRVNPLYTGNLVIDSFANSEDPDAMLQMWLFVRVCTVC